MFYDDINQNVPDVLISMECVGMDGGDGANVYIRKNSAHVLKDSRTEAFLLVYVLQKR